MPPMHYPQAGGDVPGGLVPSQPGAIDPSIAAFLQTSPVQQRSPNPGNHTPLIVLGAVFCTGIIGIATVLTVQSLKPHNPNQEQIALMNRTIELQETIATNMDRPDRCIALICFGQGGSDRPSVQRQQRNEPGLFASITEHDDEGDRSEEQGCNGWEFAIPSGDGFCVDYDTEQFTHPSPNLMTPFRAVPFPGKPSDEGFVYTLSEMI